jgi:hypothetical protein
MSLPRDNAEQAVEAYAQIQHFVIKLLSKQIQTKNDADINKGVKYGQGICRYRN